MKRTLLLLGATFISFLPLRAQVVLNQSSYSGINMGTDSVSVAFGSQGIPANFGGLGNNATYDLSQLNYTIADTPFITHTTATAPYTYEDYGYHIVSGELFFHSYSLYKITSGDFEKDGEQIQNQGFSLALLPGAQANDSLVFPTQTDIYSSPLIKVNFPAAYGAVWSSSYVSTVDFTVTYTSTYNHAPGLYRSFITEYDSVIGDGNMIVKTANGSTSAQIPVIEDKVYYQQVDSFFLNDSVAPAPLLAVFGLVQGNVTNTYEYRYYRPQEVTPLADVVYNNNTFTPATVNKTTVQTQRVFAEGIPQLSAENNITLYPNPVTNHAVYIDIPQAASGNWTYELVNAVGQKMAAAPLAVTPQTIGIQIPLSSNITPGIYYLRVNNNGKQISVKPVNILN